MPEATKPKAKPASPTTAAATNVEMRKRQANSVGSRPRIMNSSQHSPARKADEQRLDGGHLTGRLRCPRGIMIRDCELVITPHFRNHGRQARSQIQARRRQPQGAV